MGNSCYINCSQSQNKGDKTTSCWSHAASTVAAVESSEGVSVRRNNLQSDVLDRSVTAISRKTSAFGLTLKRDSSQGSDSQLSLPYLCLLDFHKRLLFMIPCMLVFVLYSTIEYIKKKTAFVYIKSKPTRSLFSIDEFW